MNSFDAEWFMPLCSPTMAALGSLDGVEVCPKHRNVARLSLQKWYVYYFPPRCIGVYLVLYIPKVGKKDEPSTPFASIRATTRAQHGQISSTTTQCAHPTHLVTVLVIAAGPRPSTFSKSVRFQFTVSLRRVLEMKLKHVANRPVVLVFLNNRVDIIGQQTKPNDLIRILFVVTLRQIQTTLCL